MQNERDPPVWAVIGRPVCVVGAALTRRVSRPVSEGNNRLRQQTIQPGPIMKTRWICLRQIAFVPNAGRPMTAPTMRTRLSRLVGMMVFFWSLYSVLDPCAICASSVFIDFKLAESFRQFPVIHTVFRSFAKTFGFYHRTVPFLSANRTSVNILFCRLVPFFNPNRIPALCLFAV